MAATRAWRAGSWWVFRVRVTTIATMSTNTMCLIRVVRSRSMARREHDQASAAQGCGDRGAGLDRRHHGAGIDRCRPRGGGDRARAVARYRDRFQHRLYAGRAALLRAQGAVPVPRAGSHDHAQQHRSDGAADARLRLLPARVWGGRGGRALERLCLALLPNGFSAQDAFDSALWPTASERIAAGRLGRELR